MEENQTEELRYECQKCGSCCIRFDYVKVLLIGEDLVNLSKVVDNVLNYVEFITIPQKKDNLKAVWLKTTDGEGYISLKHKNDSLRSCIFLDGNLCTIYEHRPDMCRMFPFNFGIGVQESKIFMDNVRRTNVDIIPSDYCKGIGLGDIQDLKKLGKEAINSFNKCIDWNIFVKEWNKNPKSLKEMIEKLKLG